MAVAGCVRITGIISDTFTAARREAAEQSWWRPAPQPEPNFRFEWSGGENPWLRLPRLREIFAAGPRCERARRSRGGRELSAARGTLLPHHGGGGPATAAVSAAAGPAA